MKKNAMLKIAAVLLVAVLLTTCAISSTFAKYVTDAGSHSETARVAMWGVEVETELSNTSGPQLFLDEYANVKSNNGNDVLAPGTSGMYTFDLTITGTPETSLQVLLTSDGDAAQEYIKCTNAGLAAQLKWYVGTTESDLEEVDNIAAVNAEIKALAGETTYTAGNMANLNVARQLVIKWEWAFFDGDDAADNTLGNDAALTDTDITFNVYAKIVQVD